MSTHISTAMHHRVTLPSWVIAAIVAAVLAVGAIAVLLRLGRRLERLGRAVGVGPPHHLRRQHGRRPLLNLSRGQVHTSHICAKG